MMKSISIALLSAIGMTGCAGQLTKTTQSESSYIVYDIPTIDVNKQNLLDSVSNAVKANVSNAQITRDIPPASLSEKPLRFEMVEPFKGSGLSALTGQSFKLPSCQDSILTMKTSTNNDSDYASNTSFFLCVQPYKSGYTVSIYSQFSKTTGGLSAKAIASALVSSTAGDASQFIPRTMNDVKKAAEQASGVTVKTVDSYIPESFSGAFYNQTAVK